MQRTEEQRKRDREYMREYRKRFPEYQRELKLRTAMNLVRRNGCTIILPDGKKLLPMEEKNQDENARQANA